MLQGRETENPLKHLDLLDSLTQQFKEAEPRIYPEAVEKGKPANPLLMDESTTERKLQKIDERLNFLKLKDHLLQRGFRSVYMKFATPDFFEWDFPTRKVFLEAASENHLCKCIIMENKKFNPELASKFYHRYVCVIIQFTTSLKNERLIKAMKSYQNNNCEVKASRKYFHYRLASGEMNNELSGYMHNAVTPFMFKDTSIPFVLSDRITKLQPAYFWLGGGHVNTKLSNSLILYKQKI